MNRDLRRILFVLAVPPVLVYALFLLVPVAMLAQNSLHDFSRLTGPSSFWSTIQYQEVFGDPYYLSLWLRTLRIGVISAALATIIGLWIAYVLWRVGGGFRKAMSVVVFAPLLISGVVRSYGWIAVVGDRGLVDRTGEAVGIQGLSLQATEAAVIVGFVHVLLPFAIIALLAALDGIDPDLLQAAQNLGGNRLAVMRRIVVPLSAAGIGAAFLLTFALSIAAYSIPAVLGGRRIVTAPIAIFQEQNATLNGPRAAALAILLMAVTMLAIGLYRVAASRVSRYRASQAT